MTTVLVVEDNPANMKLTTLFLRSAGHSVLGAVDAETGLRLAREQQPGLILMDIQLPGMEGLVIGQAWLSGSHIHWLAGTSLTKVRAEEESPSC
jgi:CheY-like chemotaxis protein